MVSDVITAAVLGGITMPTRIDPTINVLKDHLNVTAHAKGDNGGKLDLGQRKILDKEDE